MELNEKLEKLNKQVAIRYFYPTGEGLGENKIDIQLAKVMDIFGSNGAGPKDIVLVSGKLNDVLRQEIIKTATLGQRVIASGGIAARPEDAYDYLYSLGLVDFEKNEDGSVQKVKLTSEGEEVYKKWKVDSI